MPILVTKEVTKTLGENLVLAIDSGTTNTKAMLFDQRANLVDSGSAPTATLHPKPGWVEQKAQSWWEAAVEAARRLEKRFLKHVKAISTSTHGTKFSASF